MRIACIDLEGVLIPELWPRIAQASGIEALSITTREEPDYPALMRWRIDHLRKHGLRLRDVQAILADIQPYPEARDFLRQLEQYGGYQVHIVSDCFYELADRLLDALGSPEAFCHSLVTDPENWITDCAWADRCGKEEHVARLLKQNCHVLAAGDAFNDLAMLRLAHEGFLVRPSPVTMTAAQDLTVVEHLSEIIEKVGFSGFPPDACIPRLA
ncbi:bifunctional phosphoserine phosphatase/homoserine phosphotransferase ThrH [Agrobacterium tumefaciens]|uniref:bifunctional phosphoserine phosphatase/homoserine phosphotransferase ThrH n=1 Tax=Agrobacterium tumefaciens TaxID=358 RepID=UPI0021D3BF5D|nr:bifunctional phosphoserine phosphatase/homoserine phosphotransferase ThrH [Agrobacterium tumefaciens]UXS00100.1 bifunctional phosphoserine phosphatase/homoserine phosphotransferase ThrH [Agrobacterium tumefaciens]